MLLIPSVVQAVPADFFGIETSDGEDRFRTIVNTATSNSAVFFEYHFTTNTQTARTTWV